MNDDEGQHVYASPLSRRGLSTSCNRITAHACMHSRPPLHRSRWVLDSHRPLVYLKHEFVMSARASRFLSLVLRHDPGRIGIVLDDAGWTDVTALLSACAQHGVPRHRDAVAEIVAPSGKQRFALSPDGERIRAN